MRILGAETAADVTADHPHLVVGDAERAAQGTLLDQDALAAGAQDVLAARRIVQADGGGRLEWQAGDPVVTQLHARHVGGAGERRLDLRRVTALAVAAEVVGRLVPDRRRAGLKRIGHADHGGQRLVVHPHQIGSLDGGGARFGDDHRHALADVTHLVNGERVVRRLGDGASLAMGERHVARVGRVGNRLAALGDVVAPGQHRQHAWRRKRRAGIDRADHGVRVRRAQDHRIESGRRR